MGDYLMVLAYMPWIRLHATRLLSQLYLVGKEGAGLGDQRESSE
jgi:hypothetical protein